MTTAKLIKWACATFSCDTARITRPLGKMFLILGWNRRSEGQWTQNGEPFDFDYVKETVMASGRTLRGLMASAKEYKRLQGITIEEYLKEHSNGD